MSTNQHWLLWDGECGFCSRTVRRISSRDREGKFKIVPFQETPSPPMDPELYEECKKALYVVKADGTRLRGADAVLFAMQETGKGLWAVLRVPPIIWIARLVYRWLAQNRGLVSKLFFKGETCNLKERYSGKEE